MKTIKSILKDLLSSNKVSDTDNLLSEETSQEIKNSVTNPYNQENETENHEMDGDNHVDNSHAPQPVENDSEPESGGEPQPTLKSGGTEESEPEGGPVRNFDEELKEAYNKGVIDGRNSRIEEVYFPKTDDGIPHFHGNPSKLSPQCDIFSMAREA